MTADTETIQRLTRDPRRLRRWLWLVWTLPGLLQAVQTWLLHDHGLTWRLLVFCLPLWWPWVAATPWVLRLTESLPISGDGSSRLTHALSHFGAALLLTAVHIFLYVLWLRFWSPFHQGSDLLGDVLQMLLQPIAMASFTTYLLIACSQLVVGVSGRLHERELQETRILGRLAEAEERSLRMQMQPEALAQSLEDLSATVARGELEEAETAIDELAERLRETLRHGDNLPEVWSNPDYERQSRTF